MTSGVRRAALQSTIALSTALSLTVGTTAAGAANKPVATHLSEYATPSTVHAGATFTVTGAVTPKGGTVVLERLVGKSWKPIGHAKAPTGHYAFTIRSPHKPALWALRVVRATSATAKAVVGKTLHVRSTAAVYVVTATATTATAGQPLVITGSLHPKATGTVLLQVFRHGGWANNGTAHLSATSTFTFTTIQVAGSYRFRVVKAFSAKVAAGTSSPFTGTVNPSPPTPTPTPTPTTQPTPAPPLPPIVISTTLPHAVTTLAYTSHLVATGGTAPYTWAITGLPNGFSHTTGGVITGSPELNSYDLTPKAFPLSVTATDSTGRTGTAALSFVVDRISGQVSTWGFNSDGQLGNGNTTSTNTPGAVSGQSGVVATAASSDSSYALHADGTVWAWGNGSDGQLGNGAAVNHSTPVQVSGLTTAVAIAAGDLSAYALTADGTVWAWGLGGSGALGNNALGNQDVPVKVSFPSTTHITAIAAGELSAYALDSQGNVYGWGNNAEGQVGDGTTTERDVPVEVEHISGATAIAATEEDGYAIEFGSVYGWGTNAQGELNYDTNAVAAAGSAAPVLVPFPSGAFGAAVSIAGGEHTAYAMTDAGQIVSWGLGDSGELGNGSFGTPLSAGSAAVAQFVHGITTAVAVAGNMNDGYAILADGSAQAWGSSGSGSLGNGLASPVSTDVPGPVAGLAHVIAIDNGTMSRSGYAVTYSGG